LYGALQHQCEVWNRNHATLQKYAENIRHWFGFMVSI
jgi:hypothetical protein